MAIQGGVGVPSLTAVHARLRVGAGVKALRVTYSSSSRHSRRRGFCYKIKVNAGSGGGSASRTCLRCGKSYTLDANTPTACAYHGHMTGEKGLFTLSPPHQGIDGEWTDESGVIVYRWNESDKRPNTGRNNWKSRWTCCGLYEVDAPPCRRGSHASYDDGVTLF